jgi:hypothetical protein
MIIQETVGVGWIVDINLGRLEEPFGNDGVRLEKVRSEEAE